MEKGNSLLEIFSLLLQIVKGKIEILSIKIRKVICQILIIQTKMLILFRGLPIQYIVKARKGSETSGASNIAVVNAGGVVPAAIV